MRNTQSKKQPPPQRKTLSDLEVLVLRYVSSHPAANSEQIRAGLAAEHPMKDATVRTILRRLEEKKYVSHEVEGRTYLYHSLQHPETVAAGAIRQLVDRFCGGSVERLLVGMVDQEVVSSRELAELAEKIRQRTKKGS